MLSFGKDLKTCSSALEEVEILINLYVEGTVLTIVGE